MSKDEEIYGDSRCPHCGTDLAEKRDLTEKFDDVRNAGLNYIEMLLTCPNEDCGQELAICYSRTEVKEADAW